jgi:hypothetical protein
MWGSRRMIVRVGCSCLTLLIGAILGTIFLIYASTDPGPPVEEATAVFVLLAGILIWLPSARGAASLATRLRTDAE